MRSMCVFVCCVCERPVTRLLDRDSYRNAASGIYYGGIKGQICLLCGTHTHTSRFPSSLSDFNCLFYPSIYPFSLVSYFIHPSQSVLYSIHPCLSLILYLSVYLSMSEISMHEKLLSIRVGRINATKIKMYFIKKRSSDSQMVSNFIILLEIQKSVLE